MLPINITKTYEIIDDNHRVFIFNNYSDIEALQIDVYKKRHLLQVFKSESTKIVHFLNLHFHHYYIWVPKGNQSYAGKEAFRLAGAEMAQTDNELDVVIVSNKTSVASSLLFAEGWVLANYKFDKFTKKSENKIELLIDDDFVSYEDVKFINDSNQAVYLNRNLTNEPQITLSTKEFVSVILEKATELGIKTEIFNRKKIQSLKMGGLLAVNQGSFSEPAFAVIHWKSKNSVNKKPIVLIGKGVMFDTGGLNLKTGSFMNDMHMDMAGAATVFSTICAIAKQNMPVDIIALLPITDNRPGNYAFAPGDIITMANGKTVEIANTDAEGRLILADALIYAQKLDPEWVIDLATLTGSAARAIGKYAAVALHNDQFIHFDLLLNSANQVYERLVEFPLWNEYNETLKSDFADLKNLGGVDAGAITAAKFLENFVDYPWTHIDIAGPAMLSAKYGYQSKGASGFGVRLLLNFIQNYIKNQL